MHICIHVYSLYGISGEDCISIQALSILTTPGPIKEKMKTWNKIKERYMSKYLFTLPQDGTSSSPVRIDLVESVRKKIKDYLPLIASFLERPVFDKISVTAAEIALLSVTLFDFEESLVRFSLLSY